MTSQKPLVTWMVAGALSIFAVQAVYWLITPTSHPNASGVRWAAVAAQGVVCSSLALLLVLRQRKRNAGAG